MSISFMGILQVTRDLAVIGASFSALYSLGTWRREFIGKRDIELAESVLELFYKAERAIEAIRFRIYDLRTGQEREPENNEAPEQKQARDRAWVVFKKSKDHGDIFDQLYAMRFRFMTRFGKDKAKAFDELKSIVDEIGVSAQRLAELWEEQFQMQKIEQRLSEENQKEIKDYQGVIWQGWGEDTIKPRVDKIIQDIEKVCRPIIEGKGSR